MRANREAKLSEQQIDRLLRGLIEADSLLGCDRLAPGGEASAGPRQRGLRIAWAARLATAAALLLAWRVPAPAPFRSTPPAPALEIEYGAGHAAEGAGRVATFRPCTDQNAYALVLFRGWSDECACLTWHVHEFEDGSPLAALTAGEPVEIALEVTPDPPVEQFIILALARRRGDLPTDGDDARRLLACLNEAAPPAWPGEPDEHYALAVQMCLPGSAQVVRQPLPAR